MEFNYSLVVISSLFMYTYVLVIFSLANRIAYVLSNNIIIRVFLATMASPSEQGQPSEPAESGNQQVMGLSSHSSSFSGMSTPSHSTGRGSADLSFRPPSPLAAIPLVAMDVTGHRMQASNASVSQAFTSTPGPASTACLEQQFQKLLLQQQQILQFLAAQQQQHPVALQNKQQFAQQQHLSQLFTAQEQQ